MGSEMQQSFLLTLLREPILYCTIFIECKYIGTTVSTSILYREIPFEN